MSVKDIVIQYGLASVGVVLAAAVSAKMIFVWLTTSSSVRNAMRVWMR